MMLQPEWVDRDHMRIPAPAVDEKLGVLGDGMKVITQDDPEWEAWLQFAARQGIERPAP